MDRPPTAEFHAFLDRVEENVAVLLAPGGFTWHLPVDLLPPGTREGSTLTVTLREDPGASAERTDRILRLRRELGTP